MARWPSRRRARERSNGSQARKAKRRKLGRRARLPRPGREVTSAHGSGASHATDGGAATPALSGFLSFRYSSTVVSSRGGRTQVRSKCVSLEDGKLSSESFEGELDGRAHEEAVRRAEQQVLEDAAPLLRVLRWMLPTR